MKTIVLFFALTISLSALAGDDKFFGMMASTIEKIYNAHTNDEIQQAVNAFDRIAAAEKNRWEPLYYSAFGNILMANNEKEGSRKDSYLDLAQAGIDKMKLIRPDDSEVIALQGFLHMIRVTVDPGSRGPEFSGKAFSSYKAALAINPENPRALALMAQMQYGVAQFFGGSTAEACASASKAAEKYETYRSDNPLAPVWGKDMNMQMKAKCN